MEPTAPPAAPPQPTPATCPDCGAAVLSITLVGGARFALVEPERRDGINSGRAAEFFWPFHRCATLIRISGSGAIEVTPGGPAAAAHLAELRAWASAHQAGPIGPGPTSAPIAGVSSQLVVDDPHAAREVTAEDDAALLARLEAAWIKPATPADLDAVLERGQISPTAASGRLEDGIPYAGHADKPIHREPTHCDTDERPLAERMADVSELGTMREAAVPDKAIGPRGPKGRTPEWPRARRQGDQPELPLEPDPPAKRPRRTSRGRK